MGRYLGEGNLADIAPNHPLTRSQIVFGMKRPPSSKTPSADMKPEAEKARPDRFASTQADVRSKVSVSLPLAAPPGDLVQDLGGQWRAFSFHRLDMQKPRPL